MTYIRLAVCLLVVGGAGIAQTSRGTVSGTILDPSGAVVAGATLALTHTEAGVRRTAISNGAGIYRFDSVDLGRYEIKVTQQGFRPFLATAFGVEANRTTTIDVRLEVGGVDQQVTVSAESSEVLVKDGPLRGGNFQPRDVRDLPLTGLNPFSLARTLPGVTETSGSGSVWGGGYAVNGQRNRGSNFLLDGTENNDISMTGPAQPFNIADAVEEVSVQTANFGVEFGRAGGGVFNMVTKSGTNKVHGTMLWRYQSQRFNSVSNVAKRNGTPQSVYSRNVGGFTLGGPIRKDKTFFFAGFQQDNNHSTQNFSPRVPTQEAVARLRALFPSNSRLDFYLKHLGDLRGTGAAPLNIQMGQDPVTRVDRGSVQFSPAVLPIHATNDGPQWLTRIDHHRSEAHRFSLRFVYDNRVNTPSGVNFPGFINDTAFRNHNLLFADTFTFSSSFTNEFRFSYGRLRADAPTRPSPRSIPEARTLPDLNIANVASPGGLGNGQFRVANNLLFQETQTKMTGRHTFRYGVEFLGQIATQAGLVDNHGIRDYTNAAGYSAFANYLDDFSGPSGRVRRTFGEQVFHPTTFRHSYFFQDTWKATQALTLTLGLRYENFGQPLNALAYPAFPGFQPERFLERTEVRRDDNNFGPSFGLAWSPSFQPGWLARLFGDRKTVWRGGYQVSYDAWFTQMVSLQQGTAPSSRQTDDRAPATGRGYDNFFARMPATATPAGPLENQTSSNDSNLRSPYTERWSFGFQRQLPGKTLLDTSYVGTVGHKLTTRTDFNPQQLNGLRLYPGLGQRWLRTSQGNSAYHALQSRVERRFSRSFQVTGSYTWSRFLDSTSEGGGNVASGQSAIFTSIPAGQGGMRLDRGLSDLHRGQRLTLSYIWVVPGPTKGWRGYALGGWSIAGITAFQSGTPFTVTNGVDRNNDATAGGADRADIGNPAAPLSSRAVVNAACGTGYRNPDTNACVSPAEVRWVQAPVGSLPNASTVGRNTLLTGGTNNFDLTLFKSFPIREGKRLELRWEANNAMNHPQYVQVPDKNVFNAPGPAGGLPSRFLNRDFTDSGIRSMWVQAKLIF